MEDITNVIYDPTIFIKTKTYNDEIRTFCTNPGGYVTKENYYGYICVNGYALKEKKCQYHLCLHIKSKFNSTSN